MSCFVWCNIRKCDISLLMICQGFVVMLNSIGSDVWPGGGDVVWYQVPSAVTKEGSSLSDECEELLSAQRWWLIREHVKQKIIQSRKYLTHVLKAEIMYILFYLFLNDSNSIKLKLNLFKWNMAFWMYDVQKQNNNHNIYFS